MSLSYCLLPLFLLLAPLSAGLDISEAPARGLPVFPLGLWRQQQQQQQQSSVSYLLDHQAQHHLSSDTSSERSWHTLETPINHFAESKRYLPHDNGTFQARYWYDDTFYHPGGPIFVLLGGETSGKDRLDFLDTGILDILSRATSGISVVLEHRYYGQSHVTPDLSVESLRFVGCQFWGAVFCKLKSPAQLSTEQSLADAAYWVKHVQLPALHGSIDLSTTPVIFYGGSYAGGQAAFMRKLYPDVAYAAIASSGVVHAQTDSWQYFEPIRQNGPSKCIDTLISLTQHIDHVLKKGSDVEHQNLKAQFGLKGISNPSDFANILTMPLGSWQNLVWQKPYTDNLFFQMCKALESASEARALDAYASFTNRTIASICPDPSQQDYCFGTFDAKQYVQDGLEETWRLWSWQFCTEWGYFISAAPEGQPSLVSRLLDVSYNSRVCNYAFNRTAPPNVMDINQWGSFDINATRIAFIDGSWDPWIFATTHSAVAPNRSNTASNPYHLIPGGVHHYDEYGNKPGQTEPESIRDIHRKEVQFVQSWLSQFKK